MSKITAIIFLSVYILTTTEAYQLLKLPVVVQHFREHKSQNHQLSLIQFLSAHYLYGSPKDADYERDMQLPFKKVTHTQHVFFSVTTPSITNNIPSPKEFVIKKSFYLQNDQFITSQQLDDIFQPPRL